MQLSNNENFTKHWECVVVVGSKLMFICDSSVNKFAAVGITPTVQVAGMRHGASKCVNELE